MLVSRENNYYLFYGKVKKWKGKGRNTFIEGVGGGVHGVEGGREEEGKAMTRGRVTDLGHDLRDGDQLVGTVSEFIAAFD